MSAGNGTQVFSQEQPVPLPAEHLPGPMALYFLSTIPLLGPPSGWVTASFSLLDSDPREVTLLQMPKPTSGRESGSPSSNP